MSYEYDEKRLHTENSFPLSKLFVYAGNAATEGVPFVGLTVHDSEGIPTSLFIAIDDVDEIREALQKAAEEAVTK